jgi:biotin operon repressor
MFGVEPTREQVDLERLLIDTIAIIPANPRLYVMAATWLVDYGVLVARHRLRYLANQLLGDEDHAVLGLLLETAVEHRLAQHLARVIADCRPARNAHPLFDVDNRSDALRQLAKSRASALSKRWNLWTEPITLKPEALRPMRWIIDTNPDLRLRAIFKGNLKASVMACLLDAPDAGESEAELARRCGVTRKAMSKALDDLQLCGLIDRQPAGRRTTIRASGTRVVLSG